MESMDVKCDVILKPGREKNLLQRHPWIFSGAVKSVQGSPGMGETVRVTSTAGEPLGFGAWSPHSQIRVRMWSLTGDGGDEHDVEELIRNRIASAVEARKDIGFFTREGACRLIFAESDGLPGLIADWYAGWVCVQFLTAGAEFWKPLIVGTLMEETGASGVYERSDVQVRSQEGLKHSAGLLQGEPPPDILSIQEGPARLGVDVRKGHKTGFYLDQRENRMRIARRTIGKKVLNCFCYTGAFGVHSLMAGAEHVTGIDSSRDVLDLAEKNMAANGIAADRYTYEAGDVFSLLRTFRDEERMFDVIVLDPPKFIESRAGIKKGSRGYKDIALSAFRILKPGGLLCTFSCSGLLSAELFQKITADAALDAGCDAQIIGRFTQGPDHPVLLSFPEGGYLKGLMVRKK